MSKLCFVYSWKDENSKAWSGTPHGLEQALSKKIGLRKINVAVDKKFFLKKVVTKVFYPTFEYEYAKNIINNDNDSCAPYFVFGEYLSNVIANTYCYQDLSIDYMLREFNNKDSYYNHISLLKKSLYRFNFKVKRKKALEFYRNCGGVFTMSEWLKNDLIKNTGLPECKVFHVGGGCSVDVSLIDDSMKEGNKFLFVGKNWDRKNGDLVVQAFKKVRNHYPELKPELYVAGPEVPPLSVVGIDGVHFLGSLSYKELARYYNMCDYFVMPSNFEAYGLVFLEALIFGLPCIGKNCFAMPEFIQNGENGYLIDKNDPDELMAAMEKLLSGGKALVQNLKKDHMNLLAKYSWDSVADRIIDVLEKQGFALEKDAFK
ncbi:MAG: glycosyltransferase family 4 protein [Ruminococcaceae bacterium]|nr:glycosyltransferase family 4 protein [Oscillospiraceae bacterium]